MGDPSIPITLPRALVMTVFDIATESMDFGSGFLDEEEVLALRALAEALGVDPLLATPRNLKCRFTGTHEWLQVTRDAGEDDSRARVKNGEWYCYRGCGAISKERSPDA